MAVSLAPIESRRLRQESVRASNIKVTLAAGDTSPWYFVPDLAVVTVNPSGSTMKAQATFSPISVVEGDNANNTSNALAFDWDAGAVTAATLQTVIQATAVRFVCTVAGTGVGEIAR